MDQLRIKQASGRDKPINCDLDPEVQIPESHKELIAVETSTIITRPGQEKNEVRKELHYFKNENHLKAMTERNYFKLFNKHRIVHNPFIVKEDESPEPKQEQVKEPVVKEVKESQAPKPKGTSPEPKKK